MQVMYVIIMSDNVIILIRCKFVYFNQNWRIFNNFAKNWPLLKGEVGRLLESLSDSP